MSDRSRIGQRLAAACAAVAAALAAGLPPEVFSETGPLVALLLLAGHLAARRPLRRGPAFAGLALALLAAASTLAPGLYAVTVSRFVLVAAAFALAWRTDGADRAPMLAAVGAVGAALGLLAVAQKALLIDLQIEAVRRLELPEAFAVRLAQGRPYGTHAVPAALGGLLVLALFALMALAADGELRRRGARLASALAILPVAAGLVLTASAGALLALMIGLLVPLAALWRRGRRHLVLAAVAVSLIAGAGGIALRSDAAAGVVRSLAERAGNWRGAVVVALRTPVTGVGPGAFRSVYPQVRRPGEVETAYAHNSWLQLVAEGGLPWLALLAAGGVVLLRRLRAGVLGDRPWLAAAVLAFVVQNLADFTLYLPGVAVPAALLAGLAFAGRRDGTPSAPPPRLPVTVVVLALASGGLVLGGEALARRALERGRQAAVAGDDASARSEARRAARFGMLDSRRLVDSARLDLAASTRGGPDALDEARGWLVLARRLDPESPSPWHATADLELRAGRPTAAWRALTLAESRHPADAQLTARRRWIERALERGGLLDEALGYGGEVARPLRTRWSGWDDLLLVAGLALALVVLVRVGSAGSAPPAAVALGLLLLYSLWGEGGALPGVRLGRQALLAAGLGTALAAGALGPLRDVVWPPARPRLAGLLLAGAGGWALLAAALAPYPAAARDGLGALLGVFAAGVLSHALAARHAAWRRLVLVLPATGASAMGLVWFGQRAALAAGFDLASLSAPLHVASGRDPAADFLHPGHLGTLMLAVGAGLGVAALADRRPASGRLVWSAALVLAGLSGLARATLLALGGAGVAAASLPLPRRARRAVGAGLVLAAVVGVAALGWRFAAREDPYAWSRARIWSASVNALAERPLLGFGPGGFPARAPAFAIEDPTAVARFGKVFRGPHSDPLGALLALGLPGGLALLAGLGLAGSAAWRRARAAGRAEPERLGLLVLLAALAAHALVDDLLTDRPAVALLFAVALGAALAERREEGVPESAWPVTPRGRVIALLAVALALAGLEVRPYLADRVRRAGDPVLSAAIDPARAASWIAAARTADGPPPVRIATALDRTTRATLIFPEGAPAWREHGRVLEAACRGPLAEREVCEAARDAFERAVALEPHDVFSMRRAGRLSVLVGEVDAAARWFDRALADEPDFLGARLDRVRLLADAGRIDEAREELAAFDERRARLAGVSPETPRDAALLRIEDWERRDLERLAGRLDVADGAGP